MADIPSILPNSLFNTNNQEPNNIVNNDVTFCWLDCDPGHDDALAIILACYNPKIKLIGISTTAGNQTIEKTTKNALDTLNISGLIKQNLPINNDKLENDDLKLSDCSNYGVYVPIIKGCNKPLIRPVVNCAEIHGETGLGGAHLPPIPKHALDYTKKLSQNQRHFTTTMYDSFKSSNNLVTVLITGPMTNIGLLLLNYPDVGQYISKIVFMGGAIGVGNTGPSAEFNIQVDPEAAHLVFESNIPIYMVPLEVTHTTLITSDILNKIISLNTPFSETIIKLLLFFKKTYQEVFGFIDPPLHDPTAVAFVINPNIFKYRLMRVDIERYSELSYGQTVCDIYNMSNKRKNVHVCLKMDVEQFWILMIDAISKANDDSPLNDSSI